MMWFLAAPASANVILSVPASEQTSTFGAPFSVAVKGQPVTYTNADWLGHPHNVVSVAVRPRAQSNKSWCSDYPPGKCPIFWSTVIGEGQTTDVFGMEAAVTGQAYEFYCAIHTNMRATLLVV